MEIENRVEGARWRWSLLFSVVVLNVCLPSLVLSYGVILVHTVELGVPTWIHFCTPTILVLTYSYTQCWFRDAADSWGGSIGYRVMAAMGLAFVVASLLLCAFTSHYLHPYIYGILGGLGSSTISALVDAVIFDTYDSRLGLIRGICFAGQAIGQAVFPHVLTALIDHYGYSWSYIVFAGIMLQTLPAIMLLKVDANVKSHTVSRYTELDQSYSRFGHDDICSYELQMQDMTKKWWKSPSDDSLQWEDGVKGDNDAFVTITPPPSPEEKRRNIFGVEILPEIPEESEEEEEQTPNIMNSKKKRLSTAIKRLSTLGDTLEGYITKQIRRDSQVSRSPHENDEYIEVEVVYDNITPITDIHREKIFNTFGFRCHTAYNNLKRKVSIPSYKVHRLKRRCLFWMYNINDTFIKPLTRSLSCWRFYPAVMLLFTKLSLSAITVVLLPVIAAKMKPTISKSDANFLLSLHGFTWISFLLATPWLAHTPKRNYKYVTVLGLLICTAACFVIADVKNHDKFSIGCVIGGFGYGAFSSCWESAVKEFVGARKWSKLQSAFETVTGTLFAGFVVGLSFIIDDENGLQLCMLILGGTLSVISLTWFILALISLYKTLMKSSTRLTCIN